jgi:N-methylhydantoinase A
VNKEFSQQGYDQGVEMNLYVDLRYEGQNYELSVPFDFDQFDKNNMDTLRNDFDSEFDEKYGFCLPGEPIEIVNLSVTGIVAQPKPDIVATYDETTSKPKTYREVWFEEGKVNAPIYDRSRLAVGVQIHGPAVIEEDVSTVPINAGQSVERKPSGVLVIKEIQEN